MSSPPERSLADVAKRTAAVVLPAAALLPLAFLFPPISLQGDLALLAYGLSESGGKPGLPFFAALFFLLLLTRPGLDLAKRAREGLAVGCSLALLVGVAALLNEYAIKPGFAVPRPVIAQLAETGQLGKTPDEFYTLGDKGVRSEYLRGVVETEAFSSVHPLIREHWIHETGYSFPSGHSLASMTFATCFFALAVAFVGGPRRWLFFVLPGWALLVCYSRVLLRVHSPTDITVGGVEGVVLGSLAFLLARRLAGSAEATPDA